MHPLYLGCRIWLVNLFSLFPQPIGASFRIEFSSFQSRYRFSSRDERDIIKKSVAQHLLRQAIQVFLPTWEKICVWKNRQKVKVTLPLFPNYIFVRILYKEKVQVLRTPGVLQIVGNHSGPLTISDSEIALLQHGLNGRKMEPYPDLVEGELVTISSGTMRGLTGTLVRRKNETRFVLSVDLINQKASIEIDASLLKPIR